MFKKPSLLCYVVVLFFLFSCAPSSPSPEEKKAETPMEKEIKLLLLLFFQGKSKDETFFLSKEENQFKGTIIKNKRIMVVGQGSVKNKNKLFCLQF